MSLSFSIITRAAARDVPRLLEVWESSVRATHTFLREDAIESYIPQVRAELANLSPIHCLRSRSGEVYAFLGVAGQKIEMLFVHADHQGFGAGRLLTEFAIKVLHADSVDVNEQNDSAVGFYHYLGFDRVGRSPHDSRGNPFPILHMALPAAHPVQAESLSKPVRTRDGSSRTALPPP